MIWLTITSERRKTNLFNSINNITLSGNMGRDPDFLFTSDGKPFAKFSIAVSGYDFKSKNNTTMWMNCVCFGNLAEQIEKWTKSGTSIIVVGSLKEDNYTDKEGNKRKSYSVIVNSFQIVKGGVEKGGTGTKRTGAPSDDFDPLLNEDLP